MLKIPGGGGLITWKTLLFDLDGTVTDPAEGIVNSILHSLERMGISEPDPESLQDFIGPPLHESYIRRYGFNREEAFHAVALYREYFAPRGIFENRLYPGMAELLENLARLGGELVLATSKPTVYARRILEHFRLDGLFVHIQGSELDGRRTRKSEVIRAALEEFPAEAAVMVGDRTDDVVGARENGIPAVGVTWGYARPGELAAAAPEHLAHSVPELAELMGVG